jgi:hypothetical protein
MASLFAISLRLRLGALDKLWTVPLRLGFLTMLATIPLLTLCGVYVSHLGWGPSILLASILAPADPVLAHDVQVHNPGDHDLLRFALSGEGGLNEGIALPFAMIGRTLCAMSEPHVADVSTLRFVAGIGWGIAWAGPPRMRSRGCAPATRRHSGSKAFCARSDRTVVRCRAMCAYVWLSCRVRGGRRDDGDGRQRARHLENSIFHLADCDAHCRAVSARAAGVRKTVTGWIERHGDATPF